MDVFRVFKTKAFKKDLSRKPGWKQRSTVEMDYKSYEFDVHYTDQQYSNLAFRAVTILVLK